MFFKCCNPLTGPIPEGKKIKVGTICERRETEFTVGSTETDEFKSYCSSVIAELLFSGHG